MAFNVLILNGSHANPLGVCKPDVCREGILRHSRLAEASSGMIAGSGVCACRLALNAAARLSHITREA